MVYGYKRRSDVFVLFLVFISLLCPSLAVFSPGVLLSWPAGGIVPCMSSVEGRVWMRGAFQDPGLPHLSMKTIAQFFTSRWTHTLTHTRMHTHSHTREQPKSVLVSVLRSSGRSTVGTETLCNGLIPAADCMNQGCSQGNVAVVRANLPLQELHA